MPRKPAKSRVKQCGLLRRLVEAAAGLVCHEALWSVGGARHLNLGDVAACGLQVGGLVCLCLCFCTRVYV